MPFYSANNVFTVKSFSVSVQCEPSVWAFSVKVLSQSLTMHDAAVNYRPYEGRQRAPLDTERGEMLEKLRGGHRGVHDPSTVLCGVVSHDRYLESKNRRTKRRKGRKKHREDRSERERS